MLTMFSKIQPGDRIADRYEIVAPLGDGGFSRVFRGIQLGMNRPVAIKILSPRLDHIPTEKRPSVLADFSKRFEQEAQVLSRLRDPSTVTVYDYGVEDGVPYMILELVDGLALDRLGAGALPMGDRRVVKILRQSLQSLREAHYNGILHRDIKPSNVMIFSHVGEEDRVKVLDFGMAKIYEGDAQQVIDTAELDMLVGTPRYMAPELIVDPTEAGPAADIYSLGLVAYELLVGAQAYTSHDTIELISAQLDPTSVKLPDDIDMSPQLADLVERMLEKDLARRWVSTGKVIEAIDTYILPTLEERPSSKPLFSLPSRALHVPEDVAIKTPPPPPPAPSIPNDFSPAGGSVEILLSEEMFVPSSGQSVELNVSDAFISTADEEEFVNTSHTIPISSEVRAQVEKTTEFSRAKAILQSASREPFMSAVEEARAKRLSAQESQKVAHRLPSRPIPMSSGPLPAPPRHSVARPLRAETTSEQIVVDRFRARKKIDSAHNVAAPIEPLPLSWDDNEVTPPPPAPDKQQRVIVLDSPSGRHPTPEAHAQGATRPHEPTLTVARPAQSAELSSSDASWLERQQRTRYLRLGFLVAAGGLVLAIILVWALL